MTLRRLLKMASGAWEYRMWNGAASIGAALAGEDSEIDFANLNPFRPARKKTPEEMDVESKSAWASLFRGIGGIPKNAPKVEREG